MTIKKTKSKGLGDTIEKITKATGIKKVVDKISKATGKPCNCGARKEALNKMFPYNSKAKLSQKDYLFLKDNVAIDSLSQSSRVSAATQRSLLQIYNNTLNKKKTFSSCSPCVWGLVTEIKNLIKDYETQSSN